VERAGATLRNVQRNGESLEIQVSDSGERRPSWLNIPNLLTGLRFLLIPAIIALILSPHFGWQILGTFLFILAAVTDHLDGRLARRLRQVTAFGNFADPLADKLLTLSVFIAIALRSEFASIATYIALWVAIIAVREIGITVLRIWAISQGGSVATSIWGKAKTTAQLVTIITTLLLLNFRQIAREIPESAAYYPGDPVVIIAVHVLIIICMLLTVISGALYLMDTRFDLRKTRRLS
jgi:CDP-diacylglycerol--glycerol-3-phosphate 3-phosphatidyltransferase